MTHRTLTSYLQYGISDNVLVNIRDCYWKVKPLRYAKGHPFVDLCSKVILSRGDSELILTELKKYYTSVEPKDYNEFLMFDIEYWRNPEHLLRHSPPFPWLQVNVNEEELTPVLSADGREIRFESSAVHGVQHWGPVSKDKLRLEAMKFNSLLNSLVVSGYRPNYMKKDGVIRASLLEYCGKYRVVIEQGQHRISVLSALGYKTCVVRIVSKYDLNDVDGLPGVLSGNFSRLDAKRVIELYFDEE
ncbi:hypothetical protein N8Z92_04535 [Schleiferiaceae bacterium]|nr:hypothetical protein [Schleiferiaceae bacterium]